MCFDELKEKASTLPLSPGVYLMRDKSDRVIYVGKAKKLKNRVSQYFQDTASHTPKTRLMVSKIDHFDVIIAGSEFEALVLECSLIKRHQPKYNILLKDDKGYPYLRIDFRVPYPMLSMVNRIADDGASYFGPFGSRGVTGELLETILSILKLPRCSKRFPNDIGKGRPCLHYHMNQCSGWCMDHSMHAQYLESIDQAKQLLLGHYKSVADMIRAQMLEASDDMKFELAAALRDRLRAVENLGKKQIVAVDSFADTDVIGYAANESKACFTVLHFSGGNLLDKEYEILQLPEDSVAAVGALVKQYYFSRGFAPKIVFLPFPLEDMDLFSEVLLQNFGVRTRLKVPQRGNNVRLLEMANENAKKEADRVTDADERISGTLSLLGKMLQIAAPVRIESFDISNISGTDMVSSMVVFERGKPKKSDYKRFQIRELHDQDDYAAMRQTLHRRFTHLLNEDDGFTARPDLLLIDGGQAHASVALDVLRELGLSFPVFGMVKDDRHRTRALITPSGEQIRIDNQQAVFSFIGNIQEETHRFAITYHRKLRSKRLRYSELDQISGIGPKRKQELLKRFKSLEAISAAALTDLERFLPRDAAMAVYQHFQKKKGES